MVVRKVGVFSAAKIAAALYAGLGLVFGVVLALISTLTAGLASMGEGDQTMPAWFGAVFGFGAVVILPICYGIFGLIGGAIMAALYNLFAGMVGGLELDVQ